jgi:hypothetical protein
LRDTKDTRPTREEETNRGRRCSGGIKYNTSYRRSSTGVVKRRRRERWEGEVKWREVYPSGASVRRRKKSWI